MIERTKADYSEEAYGNGGQPKVETYIVCDSNGPGIIEGKRYRVVEHRAYVYEIENDDGHRRVFSMHSDTHAHNDYNDTQPPFARVYEVAR